jgi:hypothetical protein
MMKISFQGTRKMKRTNKFFCVDTAADGFQVETLSQPLSWRDDPSISLSDWTIVASFGDEQRTCHVHRSVLGAGTRQCQYFCSLFRQSSCQEHSNSTSQFHFSSLEELDGLESLLDFLYSGSYEVTGDNPVVARHLALYFQCQAFMSHVNQYIAHDLTPDRAAWYLMEAKKFKDDRLVLSATQLCAHSLVDVSDLHLLSTSLFQSILDSPDLQCNSRVLSLKVNTYLASLGCQDITARLLHDFTKTEIMPDIDAVAARGLLHLLKTIDASDNDDWCSLHNLARRCTDAISLQGWRSINVEKLTRDFGHSWQHHGKWHQESRFALLAMSSALSRAQEVCTMQEWELENLRNELSRLRQRSTEDADDFNHNLTYFDPDVLVALDATIEETVSQTLGEYRHSHERWAQPHQRNSGSVQSARRNRKLHSKVSD